MPLSRFPVFSLRQCWLVLFIFALCHMPVQSAEVSTGGERTSSSSTKSKGDEDGKQSKFKEGKSGETGKDFGQRGDRDNEDRGHSGDRHRDYDGCGSGTQRPILTWSQPASIIYGTPLSATQLNATANVPGCFTYDPPAGSVLAAGSQTLRTTFTPTDRSQYTTAQATVCLTVNKAVPVITWPQPASITVGTALTGVQLNATANVPGCFNYCPGAGAVLAVGSHTLGVTFSPHDCENYTQATASVCLTVTTAAKTTPLLAWSTPSPITYGTGLGATQLNATANVPGTFVYSPAAGTILPAGTRTLSATFTPSNTARYTTASISVTLVVNKATPVLAWATPSAIVYGTALSGTQLSATASVAGSFAYTPATGTVLAAGVRSLATTFTPADAQNYTTATTKVDLTVTKATPVITWSAPAALTYGTPLSATQLSATSQTPGSFAYTPAAGTVLAAGSRTLSTILTPKDSANWNSATASVTLVVKKATPQITWVTPAPIIYGTSLSATQLNATAPVPGSFAYQPPAGTVLAIGTTALVTTFTPNDQENYSSAQSTTTVVVQATAKRTPRLAWTKPAPITYGTALSATQLNATADVPGSFVYLPTVGSVLPAGDRTLVATFTPTDGASFTTASISVALTVKRAQPLITWATPAAITYGTKLGAAQLAAAVNVPGNLVYTPAKGILLGAGTRTLSVDFVPTDSANYAPATATVQLVVNRATPVITWLTPSVITYGTALSTQQLNASCAADGTFVYTPAAKATLAAGLQTLSVVFTPTDSANLTSATANVQLTVNKATPTITWKAPSAITFGTALSAKQLHATASVPGVLTYTPSLGAVLKAGTQTLSVTLTPTDSSNFSKASATTSLVVNKAKPTITWATPTAITYGTTLSATQLSAVGSVPGTLVYTPALGAVLNAGSQTLSVTLTPKDSANYTAVTVTTALVVNKVKPTITWATPTAITYGTALSATQLHATGSVPGTLVYTPALGTVLKAGSQTLSVTLTPKDSANFTTATGTTTLVVNKAKPTITWATPTAITYGTALSATQLSAVGSVPGTLVYSPALGAVLNAGTQTLSVTLTPKDITNYTTATGTTTLVVNKATPTITWAKPAAITYGTKLSATQLRAVGSVPGTLAYTPALGAVLNVGTQTLSVTLTPTDSVNFTKANATTTVVVNKATPTITWATPPAITYGTPLSATHLNATASVPGSFTYDPPAGSVLAAGSQTLRTTFTPTDRSQYTTAQATVCLTVNKAVPVITWPQPASITVGTALTGVQLNATANVPGCFNYCPGAGAVLAVGSHTLGVTFSPHDCENYTQATASVCLTVTTAAKTTPLLAWSTPSPITYGTGLGATQLNATANVPGTFVYSPAAGTILPAGTRTLSATFTPSNTARYTTASISVTLVVNKATPVLAWATPSAIVYGTALSGTQLSATASVAGSFAYTPATGTVLAAGVRSLATTFTPADAQNYTTATTKVDLTVTKATPVITWSAPAALTYGTPLSATQLSATSQTPGSFAYTPAAGTVLAAGSRTLSTTLTPSDSANWNSATASVTLVVDKATPQITWATPAPIIYGTNLSATQLNAVGSVPGALVFTPALGAVLNAGTQTLGVILTPTDSANFTTASASTTIAVTQVTPTITWATPAAIFYGTALGATQLNATASVPGSFAYQPDSGAVLDVGMATLSTTFTPTDLTNYTTAQATTMLVVNPAAKRTPLLAWTQPSPITYGTALGDAQLNATADVPGSFLYQPAADVVLPAGEHTLAATFTPTDDTRYTTASITVSLTVNRAQPVITWVTPAAITYGTELSTTQLNAVGSVPGPLAFTPPLGAVLNAGTQTLSVTLTPTDSANFTTATATTTLAVTKAKPTITWATPAPITYGTLLGSKELAATSPIAGIFTYTPNDGQLLSAGSHPLQTILTPNDRLNYTEAQAEVELVVNKAEPILAWAPPEAMTYGAPLGQSELRATAVIPGTFSYSPTAGTILPAGTHTLTATFLPQDATNYLPAAISVDVLVRKAIPVITWAPPKPIVYGTALGDIQQNATADVPGVFVYSPSAGTLLPAGDHLLATRFFPTDSANYSETTASVALRVERATPRIDWIAPQPIVFGTALDPVQLNASTDVAGILDYAPGSGSVLGAGEQVLTVHVVPDDTANYTDASATVSLTVQKARPPVAWLPPESIIFGTALSSAQLAATSSLPGTFVYDPPAGSKLLAGDYALSAVFTPSDSANYTTALLSVPLTVRKAIPLISWQAPADIIYGTPLGMTLLNAVADQPGSLTYSPASGTVLAAGQHDLRVEFTPTDTVNWTTASATVSLLVRQAIPTLTWEVPAGITYGDALGSSQLNAVGSVPGTLTYAPAPGSILPAGSQQLSVTLTPADATNYTTAHATVTIQVAKAQPLITWADPSSITYGTPLSTIHLNAVASVPGSLTYSPTSGTILDAGTQALRVTLQPEDAANYLPVQAAVSMLVNPAQPTLTWTTPAGIKPNTPLSAVQLNAIASVPGTLTYTPALGTVLPVGSHALNVDLVPNDSHNYLSASATVTLQVQSGNATLSWADPAAIMYGTELSATHLNAIASVPGTYVYTPSVGTVLPAGQHQLSVLFLPADSATYQPMAARVGIRVDRAVSQIVWSESPAMTYGDLLGIGQLDATATQPGQFVYTPASGALLPAGTHRLSVVFTPTDTNNYTSASATVNQFVRRAVPVLTWPTLPAIGYGEPLNLNQCNATASVPGSFAYAPGLGDVLSSGAQTLRAVFTPDDQANYVSGGVITNNLTVKKIRPVISWAQPVDIVYGTTLGAQQLAAQCSHPGTLTYDPPLGALLPAGDHTLRVIHTPVDLVNVESGISAEVMLRVRKAATALIWTQPAPIDFGTELSPDQLRAVASVPGTIVYDPPVGFILPTGDHPLTASFRPDDQANYLDTMAQVVQRVLPTPVAITWDIPAPIIYGTPLDGVQLNATATLPGRLDYTPAAGVVLPAGVHTLLVTWTSQQIGGPASVRAMVRLTVLKRQPELTWAQPADAVYGTALSSTQLNATASVSGSFVYEPASGVVLDGGEHLLRAVFTPTDADNYTTGGVVTTPWRITQATPVLAWLQPDAIDFGTRLGNDQLRATANAAGSFVYNPGAGALLYASEHPLRAVFTPANPANYTNAAIETTLQVRRAVPTITWAQPQPYRYPGFLPLDRLNASVAVPGSLVYTIQAGSLLEPGDHILSVGFTPTDFDNYTTAQAQRTVTVQKGLPEITWADPAPIIEGTALTGLQLNASASVPGSLTYEPPGGSVLPVGIHDLHVTLAPTESSRWDVAEANVRIEVLARIPVITWKKPDPITYGTVLGPKQLNATSTMPGTFTYEPEADVLLPAGLHVLRCVFTPAPGYAADPVSATVTLEVKKAKPDLDWPPIAPIVFPTALGPDQLNATASAIVRDQRISVDGVTTYTPGVGTILPGGSYNLQALFNPTDDHNFLPADAKNIIQSMKSGDYEVYLEGDGTGDIPGGGGGGGSGGGGGGGGAGAGAGASQEQEKKDQDDPRGGSGGLVIFKKRPAIIWDLPKPLFYGTPLDANVLNATSPVPATFLYSPAADTVLEPGVHRINVELVPWDRAAYIRARSSILVQVLREIPSVDWQPASPVAPGTVLGLAHLNATSLVSGSYSYSLTAGTVLGSTSVIRLTFTPANGVRYETVTLTRQIAMVPGTRIVPALTGSTLLGKHWEEGSVLTQADIEEIVTDSTRPGTQIAGRFTSPDIGRTFVAGAQTVVIRFRPFDQSTYADASLSVDLTVFRRVTPPLWLGSPAQRAKSLPPSVINAQARVDVAGGGSSLPVVRLSWQQPSSDIQAIDILRLAEVDMQDIRPLLNQTPLVIPSGSPNDAFPFWLEPAGTPRLARSPQWETLASLPPDTSAFSDSSVHLSWMDPQISTFKQRYAYRIRSRDAGGATAYSPILDLAMPFDRPAVGGPTGLTVTKDASPVNGERFDLTWQAPTDASWVTNYDVFVASAVEQTYWPDAQIDIIRAGMVESRHRWIRIGSTKSTKYSWTDDGHPDLLWSTLINFYNPDPTALKEGVTRFVDPWTVEHCRPSLLFKVVAVGPSGRQLAQEQACRPVAIDADRTRLMRPRFSNRMDLSEPRGGAAEWAYQDLQVESDATGAVTLTWAPIVYDFSLPAHLRFGAQRNGMNWGVHWAVIVCDGVEVGRYKFNIFQLGHKRRYVHKPGPGNHVYAVRIENYYNLTCRSHEAAISVAGTPVPVAIEDPTPRNLTLDRSGPAWRVTWTPSTPVITGASYVVMVDGAPLATVAVGDATLNGITPGVPHTLLVELRSSNGEFLRRSLTYPVPAAVPDPDAVTPTTPKPPRLVSVNRNDVNITWLAPVEQGIVGFELERNGVIIARLPVRGSQTDTWGISVASRNYRIRSVTNDDRRSAWSSELRVLLPADRVPPKVVTGLTVEAANDGGVQLSWESGDSADGITSYNVYRDGAYLATAIKPQFLDRTATEGISQIYAVVAIDSSGNAGPISTSVEYKSPIRLPAVPSQPEAFLVQRLRESSYPLVVSGGAAHLSYAVEVVWEPQASEGAVTHPLSSYRVYRDDVLVAEIPVGVLIGGRPLNTGFGQLLSRPELALRGYAYYDEKRCRNVWVDTSLPQPGEVRKYTIEALTRSGQTSGRSAFAEVTTPPAVAPRRPEILRIRRTTSRSLTLEVNAWALQRADPYHNADYREFHGVGAPGWPAQRVDALRPTPYRSNDQSRGATRRVWLDGRRYGRLLSFDLFGGGDEAWDSGSYRYPSSVLETELREPGEVFVGSGAQSWAQGAYAEADLLVSVNGERRAIPRQVQAGWDIDDLPCRVQEVLVDGLSPGVQYDLAVIARTPAGHESTSPVWSVTPAETGSDGFDFAEIPRMELTAATRYGAFTMRALAVTSQGGDAGVTYSWRHLTQLGTFQINESPAAKRTSFLPQPQTVFLGEFADYWTRAQTIRCYITYQGRTKYMDVDIRPIRPIVAFDPATFPIYPGKRPVIP